MYDYGLSVLSHYGLTASGTMRVRGALLCHTEQGDKLISEFGTAAEKLEQRYLLQCRITESGLLRSDSAERRGSACNARGRRRNVHCAELVPGPGM